ncbi:hypothetical protein EDF56_11224 [Novosphingobium sp. PhB165]|uniref:hypothetical protein n=1 Tax=Novosphingobium sp. PhB165 TaxID=2485105 RepID=UPI00104D682D|nr:hypothetical protein [Novosphingobium sp. PhB165]TCM14618.1 hypothetical protein EDF56_11224 [Novosphingobium sp. PhB165]
MWAARVQEGKGTPSKSGRAEDIARDLIPVWPRDTKFGNGCWELLYQAYVKGRYSPHYVIRDVELEWLIERIELLDAEVKAICERRLEISRAT